MLKVEEQPVTCKTILQQVIQSFTQYKTDEDKVIYISSTSHQSTYLQVISLQVYRSTSDYRSTEHQTTDLQDIIL